MQYVVEIPRENGTAFYDHLLQKTCLVEEVMEWCDENDCDYPTVDTTVFFNVNGDPEFNHLFTFTDEDAALHFKLRWS